MELNKVIYMVIFYLTAVSGGVLLDSESQDEDISLELGKHNPKHRHMRSSRSRHFDSYSHHDPYDYDRGYTKSDCEGRQEELLLKILRRVEEIFSYIKSSQATPSQPQTVTVPIAYPVQPDSIQHVSVAPFRFGSFEPEQVWGYANDLGKSTFDNKDDGTRPMSLDPVEPDGPTVKPPPVEHGTNQAGMTTKAPPSAGPGKCKAAILVCCQRKSRREKQQCFSKYGCMKTYSIGDVCLPEIVDAVLNQFIDSYAPL